MSGPRFTKLLSLVLRNAIEDAQYKPYCLRCDTMVRMSIVERFYWRCRRCGAEHDERENAVRALQDAKARVLEIAAAGGSINPLRCCDTTGFEDDSPQCEKLATCLASSDAPGWAKAPILMCGEHGDSYEKMIHRYFPTATVEIFPLPYPNDAAAKADAAE